MVPERPRHLVVELPAAATLCDGGFVAVWAAVVATARRRYRRQLAEGGGPNVAVAQRLLGGIDVVQRRARGRETPLFGDAAAQHLASRPRR